MTNESLAKPRRDGRSFSLPGLADRWGLLAFTVLLLIVAGLATPNFLRPSNLQNLLTQAAPLGIVVLGQTFVLLVRGLDLSVASIMATAAVVATAFGASSDAMIPAIFAACSPVRPRRRRSQRPARHEAAGVALPRDPRGHDRAPGSSLRLHQGLQQWCSAAWLS